MTPSKRRSITFCYTIQHLSKVDCAEGSFEANIRVVFFWEDTSCIGKTKITEEDIDWFPKFSLKNAACERSDAKFSYSEGQIKMTVLFSGTFFELFEAAAFPLDSQRLNIKIKLHDNLDVRAPANKIPRIAKTVRLPDWSIKIHSPYSPAMVQVGTSYAAESNTSKVYQVILITLNVARNTEHFLWNGVLFNSATVSTAVAAYFYRPQEDVMVFLVPRIEIVIAILFTQMALKFTFAGMLPPVSYLTAWDKYILMSTGFLMVIVMEACWVAHQIQEDLMEMDRIIDQDHTMYITGIVLWGASHLVWAVYAWYIMNRRTEDRDVYGENWSELVFKNPE